MSSRRTSRNCVAAILMACALAACEEANEPEREKSAAQVVELERLARELEAVEQNVVGYLLGDAKASQACRMSEETRYFEAAFAELDAPIDNAIRNARLLAETGQPAGAEASRKTDSHGMDTSPMEVPAPEPSDEDLSRVAQEQVAAQERFIRHIEAQLEGARRSSELLHEAVENRKGLKERADRAWFAILADARAAQPWFNLARTRSDADPAKVLATEKDYEALLGRIDAAKETYRRIAAVHKSAESGERFSCSTWGLDVVALEGIAAGVARITEKAARDWNPAAEPEAAR